VRQNEPPAARSAAQVAGAIPTAALAKELMSPPMLQSRNVVRAKARALGADSGTGGSGKLR